MRHAACIDFSKPYFYQSLILGDIGGYMGLLIGASCLTLIEFVDFAIGNLIELVQRKRVVTKQPKNTTNSSMELC